MSDRWLFHNRNLNYLLTGRMVSDIGSSIQMMIMPLYIIDNGGDAATVGLFSFISLLPILIMYPFGGVFGDRLNRKHIMITTDLISGLLLLMLAVLSYRGLMNWGILFGVQILVSLSFGFFDPASKGMIPKLVPSDKLSQVNSNIASLRILSGITAPLIAVSLYTTFGITTLFLINAISFVISAWSESFIKYEHKPQTKISGIRGVGLDLKQGFDFISNQKLLRSMSLFFLIIFALIQPVFTVILPLFFRTSLTYPDATYGMIQVVLFIGALLGSILVGVFSREGQMKKPFFIGLISVFILIALFAVIVNPAIILWLNSDSVIYLILLMAVLFLLYTSIMFIAVPIQTIIQRCTTEKYMSRVFSIVGLISKGGMPLGALIYGLILKQVAVHTTISVSALIIVLLSILFISSGTIQMIEKIEHIRE